VHFGLLATSVHACRRLVALLDDSTLSDARGGVLGLGDASLTAESVGVLRAVLYYSLLGNRSDLSLSAGVVHADAHAHAHSSSGNGGNSGEFDPLLPLHDFLVDQVPIAAQHLAESALAAHNGNARAAELAHAGAPPALLPPVGEVLHVSLMLDNCGPELLSDLVTAAVLLLLAPSVRVTLHCKASPVFVSDAMARDVHRHVEWLLHLSAPAPDSASAAAAVAPALQRGAGLEHCARSIGAYLRDCLGNGRLQIHADSFYTTAQAFWDMPDSLRRRLCAERLAPTPSVDLAAPSAHHSDGHGLPGSHREGSIAARQFIIVKGDGT
jgi:hypothetical protein